MPDKVTSLIAKVRPPRLKNPRWGGEGEDVADHGEELEMVAEGKGLDGRKVRFYVQHLEKSGEWTAYEEVDGEVRDGMARAKLVFHHAEDDGDDDAAPAANDRSNFRFRVALV